jgi:hypothetical protein
MFMDLPERFKKCFENPPEPFPLTESNHAEERVTKLREDLARLKNSKGLRASGAPRIAPNVGPEPEERTQPAPQRLPALSDDSEELVSDAGRESESEDSNADE